MAVETNKWSELEGYVPEQQKPQVYRAQIPQQPQVPQVYQAQIPEQQSNVPDYVSQIGSKNLEGTYKEMYDQMANRTQAQNARTVANANHQAAQQAALAGYNPQMAAGLSDQLLSGAYGANQQANMDVNDREIALKQEQRAEHLRYIDELEKTNPALAEQLRMKLFFGQDTGDLSQYFNADRSVKQISEGERALRAKAADYDFYSGLLNSGNGSDFDTQAAQDWMHEYNRNRQEALLQDIGAFREASASREAMQKFLSDNGFMAGDGTVNAKLLNDFAAQQGVGIYNGDSEKTGQSDDGLRKIQEAANTGNLTPGQLVVFGGKPFIYNSSEASREEIKPWFGSDYYRYHYKVKLTDVESGETKDFAFSEDRH